MSFISRVASLNDVCLKYLQFMTINFFTLVRIIRQEISTSVRSKYKIFQLKFMQIRLPSKDQSLLEDILPFQRIHNAENALSR